MVSIIITPEQQKIINLTEGKHIVSAPAGSGKTEMLSLRVMRALENGVKPKDMICLTFTNKAAMHMKTKIGDLDDLFVGNIHAFGSQFLWESQIITGLAIILSLAVGVGMVMANRKFVNDGDELQRKIQLESMALTLGLAVVGGIAYSQLDTTNLIKQDAEISFLVLFMGITYILCVFFNARKYS